MNQYANFYDITINLESYEIVNFYKWAKICTQNRQFLQSQSHIPCIYSYIVTPCVCVCVCSCVCVAVLVFIDNIIFLAKTDKTIFLAGLRLITNCNFRMWPKLCNR